VSTRVELISSRTISDPLIRRKRLTGTCRPRQVALLVAAPTFRRPAASSGQLLMRDALTFYDLPRSRRSCANIMASRPSQITSIN
jgi:hypothetical protein